ncbi:MAG: hypothetical protein KDD27_11295 [Saprospiraceae bacterium]|nr:hypothetical protein [Saprospiraceae bacterium]
MSKNPPTHPSKTIGDLASFLLDPHLETEHEQNFIDRIHELLSEMAVVSGFDGAAEWHNDLQASSGMAISVNEAALCLLDYRRTGQFFRGMHRAILDAKQEFPGQTIEVLYAGCGPYAPFFTLIAPMFSPDEVQFTLIEINDASLATARMLIHEMGLQPYLRENYLADATLFKVPNAADYHILFSETMDTALEREPMVSILLNLLPQLREEIMVIPQNVTVEGVFFRETDLPDGIDALYELSADYKGHSIGIIMDMADAIHEYLSHVPPADKVFHKIQLPLPAPEYWAYFALFTTVEVWDDLFLYKNDSDITDLRVRKMEDLSPGNFIHFKYELLDEPELVFGVS